MSFKTFHGVKVLYLGKEAFIEKIESNRIHIFVNGGKEKLLTLVFPDSFFETESNNRFFETKDTVLSSELSRISRGKICECCGKYISQTDLIFSKYSEKKICHSCIKDEENNYGRCARCKKFALIRDGGKDCVGNFLCNKCYEKRMSHSQINLISQTINPVLVVSLQIPVKYKRYKRQLYRARVLFYKDGRVEPHEVDLFYYKDYNVYFCYLSMLNSYHDKFGNLLMEIYYEGDTNYQIPWLNDCGREYICIAEQIGIGNSTVVIFKTFDETVRQLACVNR